MNMDDHGHLFPKQSTLPSSNRARSKKKPSFYMNYMLLFLGCAVWGLLAYTYLAMPLPARQHALESFEASFEEAVSLQQPGTLQQPWIRPPAAVSAAEAKCPEMIYWRPDAEENAAFRVPYARYGEPGATKYVTFEPDYGGFNNIRMTLETLVVFAVASNRTLVLPPKAPIYLLAEKKEEGAEKGEEAVAGEPNARSTETKEKKETKKRAVRSALDYFGEGLGALQATGLLRVLTFDEFVRQESYGGPGTETVERGGGPTTGLVTAAAARLLASGDDAGRLAGHHMEATLLGWHSAAERGDDQARKRVRAFVRAATCDPRPGDTDPPKPPSGPDAKAAPPPLSPSSRSARLAEAGLAAMAGGADDAAVTAALSGWPPPEGQEEEGARRGGGRDGSGRDGSGGDGSGGRDGGGGGGGGSAEARCPTWDPLREAVLWGVSGDATLAAAQAANPEVPPSHRYHRADFVTARRRPRLLDAQTAGERWVHFRTDMKGGVRPLFAHWYTLFLFEDYATDLFMKRLVRDYLHYDAAVFCAAGRIRARLDAEAQGGGGGGQWSSMHVRHGELQYTNVQISPEELLEATAGWLDRPGEVLYVATDEQDLAWFAPMQQRHRLRFLSDFPDEVAGLDPSLLGMVEQVVLSGGRTFTGTWFSTFSAYACRLRGYDTQQHPDDTCFVYAPAKKRLDFAEWKMPAHAFYPREWALAWEGIDFRPKSITGGEGHGAGKWPAEEGGSKKAAATAAEEAAAAETEEGRPGSLPWERLYFPPLKAEKMVYPSGAVAKARAQHKADIAKRDGSK